MPDTTRSSGLPGRPRRRTGPVTGPVADVLHVVSDPRTPVFVTAYTGGRLRYGYWRQADPAAGTGGCYVALPTDVCEELRAAGRIVLGTPVTDPGKTTYRVGVPLETARTVRPATTRTAGQAARVPGRAA
ncbi:hypothetical protein [Streptomyces sp. NPDC048002]|uniref:hypothetical protein n=1 Tax=Streptomyces sp. NPDC048002 TaxID=3154344 RepID=UPI0033CAFFFA